MTLLCKVCGRPISDKVRKCICGYDNEGWCIMEKNDISPASKELEGKLVQKIYEKNSTNGKPFVKEIGSWVITFSSGDNCISLGTPALHPFSLKLTIEDLEEILEFAYHQTGREKTLRKLRLSADEVPDLINTVRRMIEEKISGSALHFSSEELQEIADIIDMKLTG